MTTVKSIPTVYNGTRYRSKLEADWAITLDALGVEWCYEREGRYFGDQFYLPDFYLPRSDQFFEAKGVWTEDAGRKVEAVWRHYMRPNRTGESQPNVPLVVGWPDGIFDAVHMDLGIVLFQCIECGGWWFAVESGSWTCQCCGAGDGDHHLAEHIHSPIHPFPLFSYAADPLD